MENEKFEGGSNVNNENKEKSTYFIRHSRASYKTYEDVLASENPQAAHDPNNQIENDLPEAGIELAKEKAEQFFDNLDPQKDVLFFASSKEMRAFETAKIYQKIAKEKGFVILDTHSKKGKDAKEGMAREMADENIRSLNNLSLNIPNTLVGSVFNPESYLGEINWDKVDQETKEKWEQARKIINSDDKGSWGANFFHYSEEIKKIFPDIGSSKDFHERKFKNILELVSFGQKKIEEDNSDKNMKIVAFGHEDYLGVALNDYFGDHEIGNCEAITIETNGDGFNFSKV
jgi:hypothetical protein